MRAIKANTQNAKDGFAETASFIARLRRRGHVELGGHDAEAIRTVMLGGIRAGAGASTFAVGVAEQLHCAHQLSTVVVELHRQTVGIRDLVDVKERVPAALDEGGKHPVLNHVQLAGEGFHVLTAESIEAFNIEGLSSSALLSDLLPSLSQCYELVLLDGPPILGDAAALEAAGAVDGIVLVVDQGRSRSETLRHVRDMLASEGVNVLGCVLNKQTHAIPGWLYRLFLD